MFLEVQVLGWKAIWFKRLWRESLELYLVLVRRATPRYSPLPTVTHGGRASSYTSSSGVARIR